ncbi:MAG: 3'-5' exonuclease [Desulfovermiculus sp.]
MSFDPEQKRIAEYVHGALVVLAPVGTGKTTLLSHRIINALAHGFQPQEILSLTFTNLAARQLRDRVAINVPELANDLWVSTFHGFCANFLRKESKQIGIPSDFFICDEEDSKEIIASILKQHRPGIELDPIGILNAFDHAKSQLSSGSISLLGYRGEYLEHSLQWLYQQYAAQLRARHAVDFSDLIYFTRAALYHLSALRDKWSSRFQFIQVDEVQDTHLAEYDVIKTLARAGNIAIFGDMDQSIYGWRGTQPEEVMGAFDQDFCPQYIDLKHNYRATQTLVQAAQSFGRSFRRRYTQVKPASSCPVGHSIRVHQAEDEHREAKWIGRQIQGPCRDDGHTYGDIAVLCRSNRKCQLVSEVFTQLNVPHYRVEEFQFFRRKEIKDVLACLSLICNPYNISAAHRVAITFIPGVGNKTLSRIVSQDAQLGLRLTDLFAPDTFTCGDPFGRLLETFDHGWISVLDTESTGLSPLTDNIIELAYCRLHQGGVQEQRQTLLASEKPVGDSFFTHNISDAQLAAEGEDPGQVLARFAEECGQDLIVGHNVSFDLSMLVSQGTRYGIDLSCIRHQDTYDMAQRFLQSDSYRLTDLGELFSLDHKPTHRALDDVLTTVELLKNLLPHVRAQADKRREVVAEHRPFFEPSSHLFQKLREMSFRQRPKEVILTLIEELKIREHFQDEPKRRANIEHLVRFFQDQDQKHLHPNNALRNLVEYASLAKNIDHISRNSANVLVVPIHQSKGLEFDTVFIAGAVDGMMPIFLAEDLEEEKRVFYVAMTRPKKRLYITGHKKFISSNGNVMWKRMSDYVAHLGQNVVYV